MNNKRLFIKILLVIIATVAIVLFVYTKMGYRVQTISSDITDNKTSSGFQNKTNDNKITNQSPTITIISPNRDIKFKIGKTYEIRWDSSGISKETPVELGLRVHDEISGELLHYYNTPSLIADTVNSGKYAWTIPALLIVKNLAGDVVDEVNLTEPNRVYRINVTAFIHELNYTDAEGPLMIEDESDEPFSIIP